MGNRRGSLRKIRGYQRVKLISRLAKGDYKTSELAEEYDCTVDTIKRFIRTEQENIDRIALNAADTLSTLWVTSKANRIAEYEADILAVMDTTRGGVDEDSAALVRIKHAALKAVAEELGDLPVKSTVKIEQDTVRYEIVGIDPDEDLT